MPTYQMLQNEIQKESGFFNFEEISDEKDIYDLLSAALTSKNLQYIVIRNFKKTQDIFTAFDRLINTTLICIDLNYNQLGPIAATRISKALTTNSTVITLRLAGNNIGAIAAAQIIHDLQNSAVTRLNLADNNITDKGTRDFSKILATNITLKHLGLSRNNFSMKDVAYINEALKSNTALINISMSFSMKPKGFFAKIRRPNTVDKNIFAKMLTINSTLTHLEINFTLGAATLFTTVANTSLTHLSLGANEMGVEDAISIIENLNNNPKLTSLNLNYNKIGYYMLGNKSVSRIDAKASMQLSKALENNITLKSLSLVNNHLGNKGAKAIAHALKTNQRLTELNMADNELENTTLISFIEMLSTNIALVDIKLDDNSIDPEYLNTIRSHLHVNKEDVLNAKRMRQTQIFITAIQNIIIEYLCGDKAQFIIPKNSPRSSLSRPDVLAIAPNPILSRFEKMVDTFRGLRISRSYDHLSHQQKKMSTAANRKNGAKTSQSYDLSYRKRESTPSPFRVIKS